MTEKLTKLFGKGDINEELLKDVSDIHLCKWKGNPQVCDNYRGASLLSTAGKILA